jgi:hypothetical protein
VRRGCAGVTVSTVVTAGPEPPEEDPDVLAAPLPEGAGGPMAVTLARADTPEGKMTATCSPRVTRGVLTGLTGTVTTRCSVVTW